MPATKSAPLSGQTNQPEDLYEARLPSNFEGISKPSEEFESVDSFPSNSTFDSVRIMENNPPGRSDDADTRIHPGEVRAIDPLPISEIKSPAASVEKLEAQSSSTAHNIGVGETDGKRGSKLKPLAEGTVLNGRYEIVRKIGGGGMGAVYLASDNNLGGVLRAVKEMVQAHIEEEQQEKAINDFKRESMILSTLDHPSIPTIYDYFYDEEEGRFYLVMKYISGGDLSSRLEVGPGRQDRREERHRMGDPDHRRSRLSAQSAVDDRLSRPEAVEHNDRRKFRARDADRFRHRAFDKPKGRKGRDGGRHDGLCSARTFQRKC